MIPGEGKRAVPLELVYPLEIVEKFKILNSKYIAEPGLSLKVSCEYFEASKEATLQAGCMELEIKYRNRVSEISPLGVEKLSSKFKQLLEYVVPDLMYVNAGGRRARGDYQRMDAAAPHEPERVVKRERKRVPKEKQPEPVDTGPKRMSILAILSLISGILGCLFAIPFFLAIIFGHIALTKMAHDSKLSGKGMAWAGLVLGYLVLAILLVMFVTGVGLEIEEGG